ncbi:MAG: metal dependent phosphohydrolase, partial [Thermoleophilia bacterium]|nr:metal dependent phosphohydrolase [Thermoleophilia bacterium]
LSVIVVPALAPIVAASDLLGSGHSSWRSRVLNAASLSIPTTITVFALQWSGLDGIAGALTASALLLLLQSTAAGCFLVWLGFVHPIAFVRDATATILATAAFNVPMLWACVLAYETWGIVAVACVLLPLIVSQYFHSLYHRKVQLTDELADKAQILARTNLQVAAAMVRALDQRDAYTAGHSAAVAVFTRDIAREMGFDEETVRLAHLAGLLHDIGKIGVPGRVLNKTAPLDDEEYELMKTHAAMGADILGEVDLYADIAILVRYHHERIDGRGYPEQLAGDAIPAISRMISVADTYSAMTTDRPYREGMPTEKAMSILKECRGTQLDSDFTDAFLRILVVADTEYQRGKQTEFEVEVAKHQALSEVEAEAIRVNAPAPEPAGPTPVILPAATKDGELVEVELEREAA